MSLETQIIDDFLPATVADYIENFLFAPDFSWHYIRDITNPYKDLAEKHPGFTHQFAANAQVVCNSYNVISSIPYIGINKLPPMFIDKARAFLQLPNTANVSGSHNNIHIDSPDPHTALLYYVCDSDGDTFLFSKDKNNKEVSQTVSPKKNRALIFDGLTYHASSAPQHSVRCVINFNLKEYK